MAKSKTLKAIHPSAAIEIAYQRKIEALVNAMNASCEKWIVAAYRANSPEMAQDTGGKKDQTTAQLIAKAIRRGGSPAKVLQEMMSSLGKVWQRKFDEAAPQLADYFATSVKDRVDGTLKKILKDAGISVEFKLSAKANDVLQATTFENVSLIRSIPKQHFSDIEGMVMRSVTAGRDLKMLNDDLQKRFGITKRRAALISRDQNNKATSSITRVRYAECGIKYATWLHSAGGKEPRHDHVKASGKEYDIATGVFTDGFVLDDGPCIFPGELINCRCTMRPVIEALRKK